MVALDLNSFEGLFLILFLTPGYLSIKIINFSGKRPFSLDRLDKIFSSFIFSGGSLVSSYFVVDYLYPTISVLDFNLLTGLFIMQIAVAISSGFIIGITLDKLAEPHLETSRKRVWTNALTSANQPIRALIVTGSGLTLKGEIELFDSSEDSYELLVRYPETSGNLQFDGTNYEENVEHVLISGDDISQIHFLTELNLTRVGLIGKLRGLLK